MAYARLRDAAVQLPLCQRAFPCCHTSTFHHSKPVYSFSTTAFRYTIVLQRLRIIIGKFKLLFSHLDKRFRIFHVSNVLCFLERFFHVCCLYMRCIVETNDALSLHIQKSSQIEAENIGHSLSLQSAYFVIDLLHQRVLFAWLLSSFIEAGPILGLPAVNDLRSMQFLLYPIFIIMYFLCIQWLTALWWSGVHGCQCNWVADGDAENPLLIAP